MITPSARVGDTFDTSVRTSDGGGRLWEMIVGDDHQLAADNTRYLINCEMTRSENWLTPVVYQQNEEGVRTEIRFLNHNMRIMI